MQDAFLTAVQRWPVDGIPPSPAGWIVTTARNRAIDRLRREGARAGKHAEAALLRAQTEPEEVGAVQDDRLRLIFTCCHPALGPARPGRAHPAAARRPDDGGDRARLPGAGADDGAAAGAGEGKIRDARIPYRVPTEAELPDRLRAVLAVVYLVFTEGHNATSGDRVVREDLCAEAIRLGRLLAELMPDEPEVTGLLALMLLTSSRRPARIGPDGSLVLLADQDRSLWDAGAGRRGPGAGAALPAARPAGAVPGAGGDRGGAQRRPDRGRPPTGRRSCSSTTS